MRAPKTPAEDGSRGFVPGPWCAVRLAAVLSEQVSWGLEFKLCAQMMA